MKNCALNWLFTRIVFRVLDVILYPFGAGIIFLILAHPVHKM